MGFAIAGMAVWCLTARAQTQPTLSLTPTSLTFTFQIGATQFPAAQTVTVKRSGSGAALDFTATVTPAAPWLIVTPTTGKTGTGFSVRVNPTSLIAGTYLASIDVTAPGAAAPVSVSVAFIIKNPPPVMTAQPASLSFAWTTDSVAAPAAQTIGVTTDGEPFSVSVAGTGGAWLAVTPAVGVVLAGSPLTVTASVDTTGLLPGTYTGKITLTSLTAANKTVTVGVGLTVTPGTAALTSIWPSATAIGSQDATITVRGSHLFKTTQIKAGSTDLTSTWISTGVMLAVIPKALLTTQGSIDITAVNSPQPPSNPVQFTVTAPGPNIQTIVNAASFSMPSGTPPVAPGEIVSIFGSGLGPSTAILATPTGGAFPTTLGSPSTLVEFEAATNTWIAAPLIFVQANQVNCQVPFAIVPNPGQRVRVTYNGITHALFLYQAVTSDPGIFTVDSSGRGQAAALNYVAATQQYSLNSASNPVAKGGILILYVTGAGAINPLPASEGQLIPAGTPPALAATPSVTIGGEAASVLSATAVPGALGGLAQINVTVPTSVRAGKDLAVVVTVSGRSSPANATVSVK